MAKEYLGDAVYADVEHGMLKLTVEDGMRIMDTIYLEPEVFDALVSYKERITGENKNG